MTALAYGKGTYRRLAAGLPELRLVNMFSEAAATSQDGVVLISRPGLSLGWILGNGPIRGIFQQAGTFDGRLFAISGGQLIASNGTVFGGVDGDGPVSFAASSTEVIVTAGAGIVHNNGKYAELVSFPDDADTTAVAYLGSYFVAIRSGTQRFYWSALRDPTSWDGLDYASAESSPDPLRDMIVVGDVLWLLGATSIEPWAITGDSDLPFQRVEGRNMERGVIATGCACQLDSALFWIGDDHRVYRSGAVPQGLSDAGIEERIAASSSISAFTFAYEGHKFFCVRLDTETLAFDVATLEWCEFASFGRDNWRVRSSAFMDGMALLGDDATGRVWSLRDSKADDDGQPISKLFTAFQPISDGSFTLDTVHLDADFGGALSLDDDPLVELRSSRDGGKTWSDWRQAGMGRQGQYRARAVWRRFGSFDAPGGIFEVRCTDPLRFRVSAVRANEVQGGRSR
jgi:hypothetical protein